MMDAEVKRSTGTRFVHGLIYGSGVLLGLLTGLFIMSLCCVITFCGWLKRVTVPLFRTLGAGIDRGANTVIIDELLIGKEEIEKKKNQEFWNKLKLENS